MLFRGTSNWYQVECGYLMQVIVVHHYWQLLLARLCWILSGMPRLAFHPSKTP